MGIAPEETVLNTDDDQIEIPKHEIWQCKAAIRHTTLSQQPAKTIASRCYIHLPKEPSFVHIAHLNKTSRRLKEQNFDPILLNCEGEMLRLPFDEQVQTNTARCMHYSGNRRRIYSRTTYYIVITTMR